MSFKSDLFLDIREPIGYIDSTITGSTGRKYPASSSRRLAVGFGRLFLNVCALKLKRENAKVAAETIGGDFVMTLVILHGEGILWILKY